MRLEVLQRGEEAKLRLGEGSRAAGDISGEVLRTLGWLARLLPGLRVVIARDEAGALTCAVEGDERFNLIIIAGDGRIGLGAPEDPRWYENAVAFVSALGPNPDPGLDPEHCADESCVVG